MTPAASAADPRDRGFLAILLGLAVLAAVPTLLAIPHRWLWLDELLSAVWSMNGPWATLMTMLRFETHPPLYYMQLTLWMLVAQSDAWLMGNAALWHAVAVLLLGWAAAPRFGRGVALGAALLLAVSPAALGYADHVRMYSFIMAAIVLAWHAQQRWLEGRAGRFGWLAMLLSQSVVANSQTGGLLMLAGVVSLGALTLAAEGQWRRLPRWILIELGVLASSLFAVAVGVFRGVTHLVAPDWPEMLAVWTFLAGGNLTPAPVAAALGLFVAAALLLGALGEPRQGRDSFALVLVPLLVAALLSHLYKPVWIERLFVPIVPFVCLGLARALLSPAAGAARRAGIAGFVALALAWGAVAVLVQIPRPKGDGYRPAALAVLATARPGDTVFVEGHVNYWCFLWYFAGPHWGDARRAYINTPAWESLSARFPAMERLLGLGRGDEVKVVNGIRAVLWDPATPIPAPPAGEVFVLRHNALPAPEVPGRRLLGTAAHQQFRLDRWAAPP